MMVDILSATLNRAKTRSILPAACARKQHMQTVKREGEGGGGVGGARLRHQSRPQSGPQHGGMYTTVARTSFDKALPFKKMTVEQQPFKRVEQEGFTMKPTMQQPWQRWAPAQGEGLG